MKALSGNLVIAFTTTVFGILIGGFAYAASVVRRGWYEQDMSDLEFVASFWNLGESVCTLKQEPARETLSLAVNHTHQPVENK